MIAPSSTYTIYLATAPVDFRKGMDGLANYVMNNFKLAPFSGAFFVFRSKGRDKIKVLMWDGTGLVLIYKRVEGPGFVWPTGGCNCNMGSAGRVGAASRIEAPGRGRIL